MDTVFLIDANIMRMDENISHNVAVITYRK